MTSKVDRTRGNGRGERAGMRLLLLLPLVGVLLLGACTETPATPTAPPPPEVVETTAPPDPSVPPAIARAVIPGQAGGRLLFIRGGNIWVWENGQANQLTTEGNYRQPRWSPDGTQIIYVRTGNSFSDLWLADAGGGGARALTANQSKDYPVEDKWYAKYSMILIAPSWVRMADKTDRLVFSRSAYDENSGLTFYDLWIMNGLTRPANPIRATQAIPANIEGATLSPDGNAVAFVADVVNPENGSHATQIHVVDLNTSQYRAITTEAGGAYDPAWSPDGKWLVYTARQEKTEYTNLWAIHADGSGRKRLTENGKDRGATWSPEGNQIAFIRRQDNGFGLYFVDLDTSNGTIAAAKPIRIGDFGDIDPVSGVSWK